MQANTVIVHQGDNVAIALADIPAGGQVRLPDGTAFESLEAIPYSHKVLLTDLAEGADVIKYGEIISQTRCELKRGAWVHTHNLRVVED